ncbi:hypothetical protein EV363DRAFT_1286403 [Boletus edulis]|uniref:Uncharacterized protein n=1 Tax=Boletus edulis BED1 TaxID=1328754 RepID=A0AAD4BMY8_BOLED|nr:hypothetical protein EV363DRAFT_1286403 [Boletus edulis]KAF8434730.1 hypothetical protein L210DRAFT_1058637 [Boletus edulis BED1]
MATSRTPVAPGPVASFSFDGYTGSSTNVDYGLLNLMADWFPIESREKQHANEREVVQEQLEALGIADARICRIM